MRKEVVIPDKKRFESLRLRFLEDGLEKVHILSDFDRTLTKAFVNGKTRPSLISILRDNNYLSDDYSRNAHELYDKYHLFENDDNLSKEERKKYMEEWWLAHFKLLIESGLTKEAIGKAMGSDNLKFREGFDRLVAFCSKYNVPIIIMSASGIGSESIELCLGKSGFKKDNIFVISNSFFWDENGKALAVNKPIIHSLNKDETLLSAFPDIFNRAKDRKNVILIGDSIDDNDMAQGFDADNILRVGFYNYRIGDSLKKYEDNFDAIVLNDGSLDFINNFLDGLVK